MTCFLLNLNKFKSITDFGFKYVGQRLVRSGILESDAAFSYAFLLFPLAAMDNLFNTIKFRK